MKNAIALRAFKHAGKSYAKGATIRLAPHQLDEWAAIGLVRPQAGYRPQPITIAADSTPVAKPRPSSPRRKPAPKKAD